MGEASDRLASLGELVGVCTVASGELVLAGILAFEEEEASSEEEEEVCIEASLEAVACTLVVVACNCFEVVEEVHQE